MLSRLFGRPRLVLIEVASLAWLAIGSMLDLASLGVSEPWASLLPMAGLAIFVVLVYAHIYSLHSQLTPKLDLVFEGDNEGGSFVHHWADERGPHTLYRVGVRNLGGMTIEDVKVSVGKLEPQGITFAPIRLTFMHERTINLETYENLDPGPEPSLFVDVVQMIDWDIATETRQIFMSYATEGVPKNLEPRRYKLTLIAQGRDVQSVSRAFIVDVDDGGSGKLLFRSEDD